LTDLHDDEGEGEEAEWIASCWSIDWDIWAWSVHCSKTAEEGTVKFNPILLAKLTAEQEAPPVVRAAPKQFSPYFHAFRALGIATVIVSVAAVCTVGVTTWYLGVNSVPLPTGLKN